MLKQIIVVTSNFPYFSSSISLFEFEAVIELEFKGQVFIEGHTNLTKSPNWFNSLRNTGLRD